ncbi:MAG: hypothetical protein JW814_09020 [Candidatus Krumholzibacteriota bacterium]|nr:hypothetical protein [Candidatus Krumholzibacteriota bacterium]
MISLSGLSYRYSNKNPLPERKPGFIAPARIRVFRVITLVLVIPSLFLLTSCSSSTSPGGGDEPEAATWFVDQAGGGTGSGESWDDAFTNLSAAVTAAKAGDEIWVVAGTYTSGTTDHDRPVVSLKSGVSLYGGFDGSEAALAERDVAANPTILDGNDMAFHVVIGADGAVLDGFTITGGNANGEGEAGRGAGVFLSGISMTISHCIIENNYAEFGAGIYATADNSTISTSIIRFNETGGMGSDYAGGAGFLAMDASTTQITDCHFFQNVSAKYGGGLLSYNSEITVTRCDFDENSVSGNYNNGGGIYITNWNNTALEPVFNDCEFSGNTAWYGGAFYMYQCVVHIDGCLFDGNIANGGGGAINTYYASPLIQNTVFNDNDAAAGGAIYFYYPRGGDPADLFNCLFIGNNAITGYGGAIMCNKTSPNVTNCTFAANFGSVCGGIYIHTDEVPVVTNCILWDNTTSSGGAQIHENGAGEPLIQNCCIDQADYEGIGNTIRLDPLWVTGPDGDYYLSHVASGQTETSPCVDAGSDQASLFNFDLRTTRIDMVVDSGVVDMGYHYRRLIVGAGPSLQ